MARFEISNVVHKPDIRGTISLIGRAMITVGLILLLFVAYQLWGTSLFEARSQKTLRNEFSRKLDRVKRAQKLADSTTTTTLPGQTTTTLAPDNPLVGTTETELAQLTQDVVDGEPIAIIRIPKIGVDHVVISGTSRESLQKGPGHYPATPLPGQLGNSAIAGHRTTYGSPFNRLDELAIGDTISLETVRGTFTYKVSEDNRIVSPSDSSVINPTQDPDNPDKFLPTLTLTTCHPKYSAATRLIIRAQLIASEADTAKLPVQLIDQSTGKLPTRINISDGDDTQNVSGIGHSNILVAMTATSIHLPLLFWLLLLSAIGGIWWYLYKKIHNWKIWLAGLLPFLVALLFYFIHLEQSLPSNI